MLICRNTEGVHGQENVGVPWHRRGNGHSQKQDFHGTAKCRVKTTLCRVSECEPSDHLQELVMFAGNQIR